MCPTAATGMSRKSAGMFTASIMSGIANMAIAVPRLIGMKMVESTLIPLRHWTVIPIVRIEAVVDVAIESTRPMEPWSSPKKRSANKPIGPIVTVRRAIIRRVIEIAIRTYRRNANADRNLSGCNAARAHQRKRES
jgi:hypothetical protein